MTANNKALIEARINTGLRGQWYPVAKSVEVKNSRPYAAKVLGEKVVLWRDESGNLKCLEDVCPHRGAPLSFGKIHKGNISCRYHGVVVDGTGVIAQIPAMPKCALEGRNAVKSFETQEAADCVFIYIPSTEHPDAPPLVLPKEFGDDDWTGFLCTGLWGTNYRYALDNLADPMHGCYLHADSFTLAFGTKQDTMKLDRREDGFRIERASQAGENFDWTEFEIHPANMFCYLDIPYPAAAGPGGVFRIIGFVLPVDETTCRVFFWRMRQVKGLAAESFRFLYRAKLEATHWNVLEQDRAMLEGMADNARQREMLYQHDIGVSQIRQVLTKAAKSQIEAEQAAQEASV